MSRRKHHSRPDGPPSSAAARAVANAERGQQHEHICCGCGYVLEAKHLRVNFAPPDQKWAMVRAHDLVCLLDFLDDEKDGESALVFQRREWVIALSTDSTTQP